MACVRQICDIVKAICYEEYKAVFRAEKLLRNIIKSIEGFLNDKRNNLRTSNGNIQDVALMWFDGFQVKEFIAVVYFHSRSFKESANYR